VRRTVYFCNTDAVILFKPPPHVTVELEGITAARTARRVVEHMVGDDPQHTDLVNFAVLAVSELTTNAISAAGCCTMAAWFLPEHNALRIEVSDSDPRPPEVQPPDSQRIGGHGLRIVDMITHGWGVTRDGHTKTVWAEIHG
jgi:anti-sigma regulatory factor (Ser/Thr protein kinase)